MSTQTDAISVPVGARAGEYEIREVLGQGGMGTVYGGVHPVIGKEVAIKVLDPRLATSTAIVERFQREARAVNKIQHPNIIDIFAFGHSPELGHYFVMPRLKGENLGDRIARAPMTLAEAMPVVEQIVDALAAAHAAGIAHRDLKPDNIFLEVDRKGAINVQLLDFGIAKLLDADPGVVTRSGTQMGTPLFMAPEQWDGAGIDHRADIYALGIIIHHMLTGRYPFESQSPLALMNMHGNAKPTLPSGCGGPAAVDPVIARALAKDKLLRFQSATELLDALRGTARDTGAPVAAIMPPAVGSHSTLDEIDAVKPRRRLAVVVVAVGATAVASIVGIVAMRATSTETSRSDAAVTEHAPDALAPDAPAIATPTADAAASVLDAGVVAAPIADARRVAPADARRVAPLADARRMAPADARVRTIDARTATRPDAEVRSIVPDARPAPRDAAVPVRDASWGTTVDPFAEDRP